MTRTPTTSEDHFVILARVSHQKTRRNLSITVCLVTTHFDFLVTMVHQFIWASLLTLMVPATINGRQKMFGYLNAIHKDLWKVVEVGCEIPDEDETPTPVQSYVLQRNFQALNILHASVSTEEFDKIEDAPTAKDAWHTLQVNHQGSRKVCESRIKTLEDELSLFSMKKDESVKKMYNRMKKFTNQIKSLGGDK